VGKCDGLVDNAVEFLAAVATLGDAESLALVVHQGCSRRLEYFEGQRSGTGAEIENSLHEIDRLSSWRAARV
jgi:hypothetical protein